MKKLPKVKKLAKITKASLEIKEIGILSFWIAVKYENGLTETIGNILDIWDEEKQTRIGTAYGCEFIRRLLIALDVNDFSEMEGQIIWILGEDTSNDFRPLGIKPLSVNSREGAVVFADVLSEMKNIT